MFWYQGQKVKLVGDPTLHLMLKGGKPGVAQLEIHETILEVLKSFEHIFREPTELPPIRGREHGITLQPGTGPVSVRPYRYPQIHKDVMEKSVQVMLASGSIRPSHSPYSSPVLLVKKKDKS